MLAVILGQTLAMNAAIAHEIDADHSADDCSICLTVQVNDPAPPPAAHLFEAPAAFYWAVAKTEKKRAVLKVLSGTQKARAPPL